MEAAMPCKKRPKVTWRSQETGAKLKASKEVLKTKYGCIVESDESTRQRVEPSMPKLHEDHIADKGINSINRYNLVQKFVLVPQAMKIPDAKAAVDKGWKKLEALSAWQLKKVKSKKEVIKEAQKRQKESARCYIDGHVSSQKTQNWNRSIRSTKVELYFVATSSKTTQERTHSLFHWNFFARSTCTDLDVAQEKRIDDHCNVDENRSLPDSWTGFTKFTLLTHTPLKGFFVFQEETDKKFKQLLDQIIFGLKLGWKLEKPLKKKKKNKNGHSRNRNLTMPEIWEDFTSLIQVWWLQRHHQECKTEIGNADGSGDAM